MINTGSDVVQQQHQHTAAALKKDHRPHLDSQEA